MAAVALIDARQRAAFARDGYLVVPGVVRQDAVDAALQVANHWLDDGFDSTQRATYHSQSFAPERAADPEIVGLFTDSPAAALTEALVGRALAGARTGQITLRFPVARGREPVDFGPHLDGIPTTLNGVPADGRIHSFTVLAAVFLSDCPAGENGNFTVWPGTHLATARWLRERGTRVTDPDAFFAGIRELAATTADPRPLAVRAGDLVLAHYLLLHGSGRHRGPNVRYAVFFRLETHDHAQVAEASLTDPWLEWPTFTDAMRRKDGRS
jgi:ectoine hydroxylase-related dioxygenase (phytanoyl-CoA dioxygenase family)